jgi:hypothetical protein
MRNLANKIVTFCILLVHVRFNLHKLIKYTSYNCHVTFVFFINFWRICTHISRDYDIVISNTNKV